MFNNSARQLCLPPSRGSNAMGSMRMLSEPGDCHAVKIGDLITHVGSTRLDGVTDLATVRKPSAELPVLIRVVRDGSAGFIAITGSAEQ
jgi:hypothetical protein